MKNGFTTGSVAAAAAKAAAILLKRRLNPRFVEITLPDSRRVSFRIHDSGFRIQESTAWVSIVKDAGDAPDVTNGLEIIARAKKLEDTADIVIKGGKGVGVVTKPGLQLPVGEPAINPMPRQMIAKSVKEVIPEGGLEIEIAVPGGEKIAEKTFNPRLGIIGGISIIGTTGIVEPKSEKAYKVSLSLELNVARENGQATIFLASGYIGEKLLKERFNINEEAIIKIGDYVGFMLKECVEKRIATVVLIGHIGKLVKVAAGLFNTHSKYGDARLETIAAFAASCGAKQKVVNEILKLKLAEAAIDILRKNNLMLVFDKLAERVVERANEYCRSKLNLVCILLSLRGEIIGTGPKNLTEKGKWEKFILSV